MYLSLLSVSKKSFARRRPLAAAALLSALILLCGCSGTGSMYTPENDEEITAGVTGEAAYAHEEENSGEYVSPEEEEEEPRVKSAYLAGNGSDLYSSRTIDYYYGFYLNEAALQLPCSTSALSEAGWELAMDSLASGETLIPPYSYEFFDAVPAGELAADGSGSALRGRSQRIRLCLANDMDTPLRPYDCTVCGVSATLDSGVSLQTIFGAGLGNTLDDLTSVFGTDDSVCSLTRYSDGTCSLCYRFSNGLVEYENIPVLAEAEEKSLAECILADTAEDGETITKLSLYYFRLQEELPEEQEEMQPLW